VGTAAVRLAWQRGRHGSMGPRHRSVPGMRDFGVPRIPAPVLLSWLTAPSMVADVTRSQLVRCWRDVSNAGGAVGFPHLPVTDAQVLPAVEALVGSLSPALVRLLVATVDGDLAGWLVLAGTTDALTAHCARLQRVQTALEHRGTGVGRALMSEVERAARDDFGLDQLRLELRGGMGLERFYESCGWREIGRWPQGLRLDQDDFRDEVLMCRALAEHPVPISR
jgi:GNAT superfamily N-acetyltransferase